MRSYGIGFVLAGMILASVSAADAQRSVNRDMNERINALRDRLQNYQLERVRKEPIQAVAVNTNETVEVKFEKLVEEFESRDDVAVTVLFHDSEFSDSGVKAVDSPVIVAVAEPAPVVTSKSDALPQTPASLDIAQQLKVERADRLEMYDELRRRVQTATRRIHANAQDINSMVAQIP